MYLVYQASIKHFVCLELAQYILTRIELVTSKSMETFSMNSFAHLFILFPYETLPHQYGRDSSRRNKERKKRSTHTNAPDK